MSSVVDQIDSVFRLVDREVWIVTAATPDCRGGLTATWVSQASIDSARPLVLIGLAPNHFTAELVDANGAFALHLLMPDQAEVAWNFANGSGRERDKFADVATHTGATGSPLIDRCLAWLDCRVFARLATGDRIYYWADIVDGSVTSTSAASECRPLTEQEFIQQIPVDQREQLRASRERDISVQRPLIDAWRGELPHLLRRP